LTHFLKKEKMLWPQGGSQHRDKKGQCTQQNRKTVSTTLMKSEGRAAGIPTTVFTSLQARLWRMAEPLSWRDVFSDNSELTATLVVTLILLRVLLQYCHSEMYRSHSELLRFSNKLAN
jgi:hypothetical protein